MKALILAGGTGSRLRPLTHTRSKQLLPVAGRPILSYALDAVREACTEAVIVVGDTEDEIRAACGDRWKGMPLHYIRQDAPLGLAHAVQISAGALGNAPFLMYLGDNLLNGSIRPHVDQFETSRPAAMVLLAQVPDPQRFGVVELRNGRVVRLVEKPAVPPSDLALVGIYLFSAAIFEATHAIRPSARGELEITDAIQHLVDSGERVESARVTGWWKDTGKPEDLLEANRLVLSDQDPPVFVDPTAEVSDCILVPPVRVGPGCRLRASTVGPDVALSAGVRVEQAVLSDAIVMEDSTIRGVTLTGCLIGREAVVEQGPASLIIGDRCKVTLP
ncbi:MAG: glucose-1-phosphate thymidylyltransferase [Proteobacteria bacterium]|nr:glucose-1-phosphate thymidylyltransferase [Pseudomonadota bacterium]MCP4917414.1 glucose-1-phosphate thymidylyltransferase [Pseudomonadota bacterium]